MFMDAARISFGDGAKFAVIPKVRILRIEDKNGRERKIGKVAYLLAKLGKQDEVVNFAAVEVQATYFSGGEIRTPMKHYLEYGNFPQNAERRPDFRSSAQIRLMPQLRLKVPVFRRWGKKFFVVVDTPFFAAMPKFQVTTVANSENTWLA